MIEFNFKSIFVRRATISREKELKIGGEEDLDQGNEGVSVELPSYLET